MSNPPIIYKKFHKYRPIDEYKEYSNSIYDLNDLDIFENKVDNLF